MTGLAVPALAIDVFRFRKKFMALNLHIHLKDGQNSK